MKNILQTLAFLFLTQIVFGQTQFQMRYGSHYRDQAQKVIQVQDGNFIVVGNSNGFGSGGNAIIMKVNAAGTLLWVKDYSGINAEVISDVIELSDTKLIMCGRTYSYGAGASDAFVMKTDSTGAIIWARAYGDILDESFVEIAEDGAGGFYVAGAASNVSIMQAGATVSRMDGFGTILWTRFAGDLSGDVEITAVASGGVILGECIVPDISFSLWKFSSSGNLVWSNNYLPTPVYSGFSGLSIIENNSGEILVNYSLANQNTVATALDNFILKLDNAGNVIWNKSYGGTYSDEDAKIANTSDGGTIICGITNSAGNGDKDACLIKVQASGAVQWAKAYGTVWADIPANVVQTSDDGFIFTGVTWPVGFDNDSSKFYLVKTDSLGNIPCGGITWYPVITNQTISISAPSTPIVFSFPQDNSITWNLNNRVLYQRDMCAPQSVNEILSPGGHLSVYPNPFSTTAIITIDMQFDDSRFELFDIYGQVVKQIQLTGSSTEISRDDLASGIYIYQLVSDNKIIDRGKIIVQ